MTHIRYFLIFAVITGHATFGQSFNKSHLIGSWELTKEENDLPDDLPSIFDEPESVDNSQSGSSKREILLIFQPGDMADLVESGDQYKVPYLLKDSVLTIGTRSYKLLLLNKKEMTLVDDSELSISPSTYYYQRVTKPPRK